MLACHIFVGMKLHHFGHFLYLLLLCRVTGCQRAQYDRPIRPKPPPAKALLEGCDIFLMFDSKNQ